MTVKPLKYSMLLGCAFVLGAPSAQAADLGGDCCADLEERIAELEATTARKGNKKVSLQIYGQVNAGLLSVDVDGFSDERITQMGSDTDGTFVGFRGTAQISPGWSAGYVLEIDFRQLGLADLGINENPEPGVRQSYWFLQSDTFGAVSVGRTAQATQAFDMITTANTYVAAKPLSLQPVGDAYLTGLDVPFDGNFRDVIRYDSPAMAGFRFSASWGDAGGLGTDGDTWDVALRYAGEWSQIKVAAGIGYRHDEDFRINLLNIASLNIPTGDVDTFLLSGSAMHAPSGLFLSGYYADQDWDDVGFELKGWQFQGGIENKFFTSLGKTTLYGEYGEIELDTGGGSGDIPLWGLGVVQAFDAAALDLYLSWRQYDLDDLDGGDADVITAGAKIQF